MSNLQPCTFSLLINLPNKNDSLHIEGEIEDTGNGYLLNASPSSEYRRWFTMPLQPNTSYGAIAQLIAGAVGQAS